MFIESPRYTERFGSVRMNHVQKVVALDSGVKSELPSHGAMGVIKIDEETIKHFEDRMAIVIPVKEEKLKLFEGVVSGVPHDCLVIVVSNSQIEKVDRFRMEGDALAQLCRFTSRQALIAHQKDPAIAEAAMEAGYNDLLGEDGLVRNGKSEAMVIGLLLVAVSFIYIRKNGKMPNVRTITNKDYRWNIICNTPQTKQIGPVQTNLVRSI